MIDIIQFPVFCNYLVHVEVSSDFKKTCAKYPQTKSVPVDGAADGITVHVHDDAMSFVFLKPHSSAGDIAHESYHVVRRMMKYMGVEEDNECVAYHLGYLTQKVFKFIHGRKRNRKKCAGSNPAR